MEKNLPKSEEKDKKDARPLTVRVRVSNLLFDGKTPGYEKRFKSWAKGTYGEHLENLVDALLSSLAQVMVTGKANADFPDSSVEFLRGEANGILLVADYIRTHASETKERKPITGTDGNGLDYLLNDDL